MTSRILCHVHVNVDSVSGDVTYPVLLVSGLVDSDSMFIFNLSSVEATDRFIHSDIHIFKKRRRVGTRIRVTLYELAPFYVTQLGTRDVSSTSAGWFTFSVNDAVKSCLSVRRKLPHILALSFTKLNTRGKQRPLRLAGFMRQMTRPFLVVYTNSSLNLTHDHVTLRRPIKTRLPNTFYNPETGRLEKFDPRKSKSPKASRQHSYAYAAERPSTGNIPYLVKPSLDFIQTNILNSKSNRQPGSVTVTSSTTRQSSQAPVTSTATAPQDDANIWALLAAERPAVSHRSLKDEILSRRQRLELKDNSLRRRFIRSVADNQLPQDSVLEPSKQTQAGAMNNDDAMLASNSAENHIDAQTDDVVFPTPEVDVFSDDYVKSQYLPQLEREQTRDNQRARRRKLTDVSDKNRIRNNNEEPLLPYPDGWESKYNPYSNNNQNDFNAVNSVMTSPFSHTSCHVEHRILDFADIGWSEWILEPRAFQSNFCAGTCTFPNPQVTDNVIQDSVT